MFDKKVCLVKSSCKFIDFDYSIVQVYISEQNIKLMLFAATFLLLLTFFIIEFIVWTLVKNI